MVFEHIEKLKQHYTDKYVVVDETRPELKRFKGMTGTVKTVNMSGRALVQFDGYNNIGWYDIDPAFLKVIDQSLPKPEEKGKKAEVKAAKPAAAKPPAKAAPAAVAAPAAKPAPTAGKSIAEILAAARSKPGEAPAAAPKAEIKPAAKPASGGKMSMADILAAARGNKPAGAPPPAAKAEEAPAPPKAPAKPAAAKPAPAPAAAPAAKVDPQKMSMAEILAAARANKPGAAAPAAAPSAAAEEPVEEEAAAENVAVAEAAPAQVAPLESGGKSKKVAMSSYAEMIAYCRKVDAK